MATALVTPWWYRRRAVGTAEAAAGSTDPTPILDWHHPLVRSLAEQTEGDQLTGLRTAHRLIAESVRPVYAVNDKQPISRTLRRGRGSCSQRLAILEGVARGKGIPTRVRGLVVDGRFWYPRFPRLKYLVPSRVLLAWPEFRVAQEWLPVGELFGGITASATGTAAFTNTGAETLFDAVARTAVDWDGLTCTPGNPSACDLSATVLADLGRFDSRDELFARHGQTLCGPITALADPILSRWAPAA
ncbi:transglutaminase domain-containing protein [Amycolatopsis sp. NPDC059021]|uniref:transglutaminase domain-containing protein n=1 Tax=Amycolatopsis sp. NPDC059021 TaxID=3346704 RepID=UPI00366ACC15